MSKFLSICVFASHGGGNFKYLLERRNDSLFEVSALVVDVNCGAEIIAAEYNIPIVRINRHKGKLNFKLLANNHEIITSDLIILTGFLPILPHTFIKKYSKPILNTHPSLLPSHGGKGMYGVKVQESVIKSGDLTTGCTCHLVDSGIDTGKVICQKKLPVNPNLSPWGLGGEVFLLEGPNLIDAINIIKNSDN